VLFLYPDAISWVQSEGKESPVSSDVPGQAGFDAGDNDRYYTLPGSGTPQVTQLARSAVDLYSACSMYVSLADARTSICSRYVVQLVVRRIESLLQQIKLNESAASERAEGYAEVTTLRRYTNLFIIIIIFTDISKSFCNKSTTSPQQIHNCCRVSRV